MGERADSEAWDDLSTDVGQAVRGFIADMRGWAKGHAAVWRIYNGEGHLIIALACGAVVTVGAMAPAQE